MVHVALITNADLVIYGISEILAEAKDVSLIGIANDLAGCKMLAKQESPDVIIMDAHAIQAPGITQLSETVEEFKQLSGSISFISLTDWSNPSRFKFARQMGFKGFCLKTISRDELIEAIKTVARGETYIHSKYAEQVQEQNNNIPYNDLLGARQQEILNLLLDGYTNREIANILYLSPETVKSHIKVILKKLKVRDRTQAVSLVLREMIDNSSLQKSISSANAPASAVSFIAPAKNQPSSNKSKKATS